MNEEVQFVDLSHTATRKQQRWPTIVVPRAAIDREIKRLACIERPVHGRRTASVNHPSNTGPVPSFAPGIDVQIQVLKPGEETAPIMRNSTQIEMCIRGEGTVKLSNKTFKARKYDVWNIPAVEPQVYRNDGEDLFVRLSYSNAPMLERLEIHYTNEDPFGDDSQVQVAGTMKEGTPRINEKRARDNAKPIYIGNDGAQMLGYEWLVDISAVESKSLLWPWTEVQPHLETVYERDLKYTGRHLYLLYNPATERRMGTSHSFFATIAKLPPGKLDQPHRHTSAAINYIMWGKGKSTVEGNRVEWEEGDLHFSAPGWAVHNHGSRDQGFIALTIQDHPLQLAMESLLWQETLKSPIVKLGSSEGIDTNLTQLLQA